MNHDVDVVYSSPALTCSGGHVYHGVSNRIDRWQCPVPLRNRNVCPNRPFDRKQGIVPSHPAGCRRHVFGCDEILELAVVGESLESMRAAFGNIDCVAPVRQQFDAAPTAERWRFGAKVDDHVEYGAADAANELGL